jgi:hypothetical protein
MSVRFAAAEGEDLTLCQSDAIASDAPDLASEMILLALTMRKRDDARRHDEGTHMKIMVSAVFAILLAPTTAQAQQSQRDVAPARRS